MDKTADTDENDDDDILEAMYGIDHQKLIMVNFVHSACETVQTTCLGLNGVKGSVVSSPSGVRSPTSTDDFTILVRKRDRTPLVADFTCFRSNREYRTR